MKTLIEAVEKWIDDKITDNIAVDRADRMSHSATVDVQELNAKLNEMEKIHIRDANRIAELERRVMSLDGDNTYDAERATTIESRLHDLERRVDLNTNSPSPESDDEESTVTELSMRLDDVDSRLDDLECSMEEKIDSCDVEDKVESAMSDLDLPDSYAIEVMIDDAVETKVMDAVIAEINATDFKITVER